MEIEDTASLRRRMGELRVGLEETRALLVLLARERHEREHGTPFPSDASHLPECMDAICKRAVNMQGE